MIYLLIVIFTTVIKEIKSPMTINYVEQNILLCKVSIEFY